MEQTVTKAPTRLSHHLTSKHRLLHLHCLTAVVLMDLLNLNISTVMFF